MTDDEIKEIKTAYSLECSEKLAEIEAALLSLEPNPTIGDEFSTLFRAVHTIKGSSSIVGADQIEMFCHALEELLTKLREHELLLNQEMIPFLLKCHDHIRALVTDFETDLSDQGLKKADELLLAQIGCYISHPKIGNVQIEATTTSKPQESEPSEHQPDQKFVRVDAHKLDQLINLVVELVTASSILEANVRLSSDLASIESSSSVSALVKQVQERAMSFRMIPVGDLFKRFQRSLHDMAATSGKSARLVISGGESELDKVVAEKLKEPLLHLMRNAVDHGLETSDDRIVAGKSATGTIELSAFHEAGAIVIEISDDGRGINKEKVLRRALANGLLRPEEAGTHDVYSLIFEPGFTTLEEATLLSGRGVGMDVVKKQVEALRGKIDISSQEGEGTRIQLRIPLSLALIDGFMVIVGKERFIMPMELIEETIDLPPESLKSINTHGYLELRGEALSCLDLLELTPHCSETQASRFAVVVKLSGVKTALIVDRLEGETKAVIKPLGKIYRNVRAISGASILGDGSIALILDISELLSLVRT